MQFIFVVYVFLSLVFTSLLLQFYHDKIETSLSDAVSANGGKLRVDQYDKVDRLILGQGSGSD